MKAEKREAPPAGGASDAAAVYRVMVEYLRANGWTRQEEVSGWWWKDDTTEDAPTGSAVECQLERDGIDLRVMLPDEPHEFWPVEDDKEWP